MSKEHTRHGCDDSACNAGLFATRVAISPERRAERALNDASFFGDARAHEEARCRLPGALRRAQSQSLACGSSPSCRSHRSAARPFHLVHGALDFRRCLVSILSRRARTENLFYVLPYPSSKATFVPPPRPPRARPRDADPAHAASGASSHGSNLGRSPAAALKRQPRVAVLCPRTS